MLVYIESLKLYPANAFVQYPEALFRLSLIPLSFQSNVPQFTSNQFIPFTSRPFTQQQQQMLSSNIVPPPLRPFQQRPFSEGDGQRNNGSPSDTLNSPNFQQNYNNRNRQQGYDPCLEQQGYSNDQQYGRGRQGSSNGFYLNDQFNNGRGYQSPNSREGGSSPPSQQLSGQGSSNNVYSNSQSSTQNSGRSPNFQGQQQFNGQLPSQVDGTRVDGRNPQIDGRNPNLQSQQQFNGQLLQQNSGQSPQQVDGRNPQTQIQSPGYQNRPFNPNDDYRYNNTRGRPNNFDDSLNNQRINSNIDSRLEPFRPPNYPNTNQVENTDGLNNNNRQRNGFQDQRGLGRQENFNNQDTRPTSPDNRQRISSNFNPQNQPLPPSLPLMNVKKLMDIQIEIEQLKQQKHSLVQQQLQEDLNENTGRTLPRQQTNEIASQPRSIDESFGRTDGGRGQPTGQTIGQSPPGV